jgi:hypothetical protein
MPKAGCTRSSGHKQISKWERESAFRASSVVKKVAEPFGATPNTPTVCHLTPRRPSGLSLVATPTNDKPELCIRWAVRCPQIIACDFFPSTKKWKFRALSTVAFAFQYLHTNAVPLTVRSGLSYLLF